MAPTTVFNGVITPSMMPHVSALYSVACILSTIFVGLRFLANWKRGTKFALDDFILLVALVILYGQVGLGFYMNHTGLGIHASIMTNDQKVQLGKALLSFECVYVVNIALIKVSLLFSFHRLFPTRNMRIWACGLGGIALSWAITIGMLCIFQCNPVQKAWNPWLKGHCIDLRASFIANAVPNIITDIVILVLPLKHVWELHTTPAQRMELTFVFLQGSFVVFISIYRFKTLFAFDPKDLSWTLATSCAWCVMEAASGIISACLFKLRPLLQALKEKLGLKDFSIRRLSIVPKLPFKLPSNMVTIGGHDAQGRLAKKKIVSIPLEETKAPTQPSTNKTFDSESSAPKSLSRSHRTTSTQITSGSCTDESIPFGCINVETTIEWREEYISDDSTLQKESMDKHDSLMKDSKK